MGGAGSPYKEGVLCEWVGLVHHIRREYCVSGWGWFTMLGGSTV